MAPQKAAAQVNVSFQIFYDNRSPYGNWVNNSNYGYVWVTDVATEFSPYSKNGYWVFTKTGWTWISNYSCGCAPIGPGINIDVAYGSGYNLPFNHRAFVRNRYFGRTNILNYYINNSGNGAINNNTTVTNNIRVDANSEK